VRLTGAASAGDPAAPAGTAAAGTVPAGTVPAGTVPAGAADQPARAARPSDPGGLRPALALTAALAGGLALAAAFPPAGIWPLVIAGPALLTVALWRQNLRASLLAGLVFGAAFFVPLLSWLVNVAWYAWAALAGTEAVIFGVLAVGQCLLLRLRAWPLAVAAWWVCAEALRARWPYAFPWGRLAMSQAGAPTARWAAIGGAPLLTFAAALAAACLAWLVIAWLPPAWLRPGHPARGGPVRSGPAPDQAVPDRAVPDQAVPDQAGRHQRRRKALPAVAFGCAAAVALGGRLLPVDQAGPADATAAVAAVQGNVPRARNLPALLRAGTVTQNHAAATEQLAARVRAGLVPDPGVVIWPENSTDLDPSLYPTIYGTIAAAVSSVNRPVLVGAVLQDPRRNAGQLWLPRRGPVAVYVKRQLVPFGEYIPLRGLLSHLTSLTALQPVNFTAGRRAVVFRLGKIRLGDIICYEVSFDALVRSEVTAGANLLAVQSNDADFELDGQTGESQQQIAMARIRAIESNRAVVYASTTGESAIIEPDGTVLARTGLWQRSELDARLPLRTGLTLADRLGSWPETAGTVATLAALAWVLAAAALGRRRRRRSRGACP